MRYKISRIWEVCGIKFSIYREYEEGLLDFRENFVHADYKQIENVLT
jgi:hypothetical protein